MGRYVEGQDRTQSILFPERLDDWVDEDNPVRAIEAFVDALDLRALGFERAEAAATGRPGYHPATLLKIYVYGYLNRVQSSRRLERETQRNIELVWLTGRLMPDFKTIADFRKDNGPAIRQACKQFVALCNRMGLFEDATVALDGSKFKAVNNRDKNFTVRKLQARMQQLDDSVQRYLTELDRADREPSLVPQARVAHLKAKLLTVKAQMSKLQQIQEQLDQSPDGQVSLTDPDARSMATSGRGTGVVGYNVQASVDTKHHLIVAHEVTNQGHDRTQLATMAGQAKAMLDAPSLVVLADRGYFKGEEIVLAERSGIVPLVPKPQTSNNKAAGLYDKQDFIYLENENAYLCPAKQRAVYRTSSPQDGMNMHWYWSSSCSTCAQKSQCTTGKHRRISRWEHEDVLDRMQKRLEARPQAARERRQTVEHVFGTLKGWMGTTHFLTKTLPKVRTEMSLQVLAYNLKRMMTILGTRKLIEAIEP